MKSATILLAYLAFVTALVPPKFQWKTLDYAWGGRFAREEAIATGSYVPENNMPAGIARWKDKLFITVPRWKSGVPASLNYIATSGAQTPLLQPYPNWDDAYLPQTCCPIYVNSNATIVSTYRVHVDKCDRLWVVDNGVVNMLTDEKITDPAIVVFDLNTNQVILRYSIPRAILSRSSVLTSIVVETPKGCERNEAFAYITDMGSNTLIVYSQEQNEAWRVDHPYFNFDPYAAEYKVGGIEFFWNDGVSSATLGKTENKGYSNLYLHPTSSTRQFKVSTEYLRTKNVPKEDFFDAVEVVGDRGPKGQATACDFDPKTEVLFYTQLSKNGVGCWNTNKPFNNDTAQVILSDCNLLEFPSDIKVDDEGNLWVLSNRQSRFLYESMDFNATNFRVLSAPTQTLVKDTPCDIKYNKKKSK